MIITTTKKEEEKRRSVGAHSCARINANGNGTNGYGLPFYCMLVIEIIYTRMIVSIPDDARVYRNSPINFGDVCYIQFKIICMCTRRRTTIGLRSRTPGSIDISDSI